MSDLASYKQLLDVWTDAEQKVREIREFAAHGDPDTIILQSATRQFDHVCDAINNQLLRADRSRIIAAALFNAEIRASAAKREFLDYAATNALHEEVGSAA